MAVSRKPHGQQAEFPAAEQPGCHKHQDDARDCHQCDHVALHQVPSNAAAQVTPEQIATQASTLYLLPNRSKSRWCRWPRSVS